MSKFKLVGGEKSLRLNPYKRITKGTEVTVLVDGVETVGIIDAAGKYTYLNVDGVDYYVSAALAEGAEFTTEAWEPKAKPEPKPVEVDEAGEPVAQPKAKRGRKPKGEAAEVS